RASGLPGSALLFPLALRASTEDSNSVVRTVLSVDEATQSMTFAGNIPTGWYAKLMRANFDRLILGAQAAGAAAMKEHAAPALSDEGWRELIALVSRTYQDSDQDRYTLERSIEISSREMQGLYEELQRRAQSELAVERHRVEESSAVLRATLEATNEGILVVD